MPLAALTAHGLVVPCIVGRWRTSPPARRRNRVISGAELQGTVPMWARIGDVAATTFSY